MSDVGIPRIVVALEHHPDSCISRRKRTISAIFLGLQVYQLGNDVLPLAGIRVLGKLTRAKPFRHAACATESR